MAKAAIAALLGAVVLVGGSVAADTLADGLAAFDSGDYREAVRIWQPLADRGDDLALVALVALAGLYRTGTGAAQGRTWADRHRRLIGKDMSRAEIAEADRRAADFRPIPRAN